MYKIETLLRAEKKKKAEDPMSGKLLWLLPLNCIVVSTDTYILQDRQIKLFIITDV